MHETVKLMKRVEQTFPGAFKALERFRLECLGDPELAWPQYVWAPMALTQSLLEARYPQAYHRFKYDAAFSLADVCALDAWRRTKGIYRFDKELHDALVKTPLKGDIPIATLRRMPEWCIYIETPEHRVLSGFFAHLEYDANTHREELRLVTVGKRGWTSPMLLHLGHGSVKDCIEAFIAETRAAAQTIGTDPVLVAQSLKEASTVALPAFEMALNLLLYLCSDEPDVQGTRKGQRQGPQPSKAALRAAKRGAKNRAAKQTVARQSAQNWDVGLRIGSAIRKSKEAVERRKGAQLDASGAPSPTTHVRAAHWHLYWVGKGRQTPKLRWLSPILVGGGLDDLSPTVRPVKG